MVDFSDDTTLYGTIGVGVVLCLIVLLCCCCCCRRRKSKAAKRQEAEAEAATAALQAAPSQKHFAALDIEEDHEGYAIMPTSPAEDTRPVRPLSQNFQHKAVVLNTPPAQTVASPITTTANSVDRTMTPGTHNSNGSNNSGPRYVSNSSSSSNSDPLAIAEDPAIVASRLPFDTITALVQISKGGFGEVYKGSYRGNIVAIKRLLPETRRDLKQIASFLQEVKIMATMEHEHIVKFIGVAWDSLSDMSVVTEYMEGGDLRTALNEFNRVGRPLGFDKQKATIALHAAHALTYMHSLQPVVLHRDFKSKNILLDETQTIAKITDFGVSRERSDQTMTAGVGTLLWMAPEVMAGDRYNEKADVFSFGIVLSELDTYNMPYADVKARLAEEEGRSLPDTAMLQRIMSGRVTVTFSPELRSDVRQLGLACVALDPNARPTAAQVLYELQKIERTMASEISIVL